MENDAIREGDKVNVYFENVPWIINATIKYTPGNPGECYYLILEDGRPCNVLNFAKMEKVKEEKS